MPEGRRQRRRFQAVAVVVVIACLLSFTVPLFAKSWRVTDFKDTISIAADGKALVDEKITLAFIGQWRGIHRTIPVEYPGPDGAY